jgi:parallel beta-helix repeat protein
MNTRKLRISMALALATLTAAGVLVLVIALGGGLPTARAHTSSVWTVCPTGSPDCDFDVVQDAVDAANNGDMIKVAAGIYDDVHGRPAPPGYSGPSVITQAVLISKSVTVQGGYTVPDFADPPDSASNATTLDAGGTGRVFFISGNVSPTIQGLIITGGDADALGGKDDGTDAGGGMYVITSTVTVSDCLIHDNHADNGDGGGLYLEFVEDGVITHNEFRANSAQQGGGGLALRNGTITVGRNSFTENQAASGGGMDLFGSNSTVSDNLVRGNTAGDGGGIELGMFGGRLDNNVVISNTARENGGGISVFGGNTWRNNVVTDNRAGGSGSAFYIRPVGPELVHTTIARNSSGDGSAIYITDGPIPLFADVKLVNTVFVSHSVGISVTAGHSVTLDTVLWYNVPTTVSVAPGGFASVSNELTGDPAFATDGYHVTADSAAIDQGMDAGVPMDIDGQQRPVGQGYDLGADEFWHGIYLPVTLRGN